MAFDNGSGSGGGNGSVWWELRHGSARKKQQLVPIGFESQTETSARADARSDARARRRPAADGRPGAGEVRLCCDDKKTHSRVEIHDRTGHDDIGAPDHRGMFRVRLRIKKAQLDAVIAKEKNPRRRRKLENYRSILPGLAKILQEFTGPPPIKEGEQLAADDVYLVIDVPAIKRTPANGKPWSHMPWEIYWQW